jgi:hypothetical protein
MQLDVWNAAVKRGDDLVQMTELARSIRLSKPLFLDITHPRASYTIITQSVGEQADRLHDIRVSVETDATPAMKRHRSGEPDHDRQGQHDDESVFF